MQHSSSCRYPSPSSVVSHKLCATKDREKDGDKPTYQSAPPKLISRQIISISVPYKRSFAPNILQIIRNKHLISLPYLNVSQAIVLMLIPTCTSFTFLQLDRATESYLHVLPFALRVNPGQIGIESVARSSTEPHKIFSSEWV